MDSGKLKILLEKLNGIEDAELKNLVLELIEERNALNNAANIDSLTGTYNRRIIDDIVRFNVVVMCDIDRFKIINDTYGHTKGDEILRLVSNTFKKNIRNDDIICRYGGDEFLLVFSGCDINIVLNRIDRINSEILSSSKILDKSLSHNITLSYGLSINKNNKSIEEAIEEADKNLYISKSKGCGYITIPEEIKIKNKK